MVERLAERLAPGIGVSPVSGTGVAVERYGDGSQTESSQELCHLFTYAAFNITSGSSLPYAYAPMWCMWCCHFDSIASFLLTLGMTPSLSDALKSLELVVNKRKALEAVKTFKFLKREPPVIVNFLLLEHPPSASSITFVGPCGTS